jgi:hypothetical protein
MVSDMPGQAGVSLSSRQVLLGASVWLAFALIAGAAGVVAIPPPFPQVLLLGLTLAALLATFSAPALRAWALQVDVRLLVLFHLTRFVGIYFLVLNARGELPWAFAVPGGWGDIVAAVTAIVVMVAAPTRGAVGWWMLLVWNLFGFLDIAMVVATAARLALTEPGSMRALIRLPLALLVTFVVPIIIATHVVIFVRLGRSRRRGLDEF